MAVSEAARLKVWQEFCDQVQGALSSTSQLCDHDRGLVRGYLACANYMWDLEYFVPSQTVTIACMAIVQSCLECKLAWTSVPDVISARIYSDIRTRLGLEPSDWAIDIMSTHASRMPQGLN